MIYTEYDPLQSVIVGDTYSPGDVDHLLTKGNIKQFNHILEETKQDLEALSTFLTKGGIEVYRPNVYKYNAVKMPQFNINVPIAPIVPRDQYMVMGCLLYTSPSPRDGLLSRMPSSA